MNRKTFCLICSENVVLKEYNTGRHYNSKHKETYENCAVKREKVAALKRRLPQQNVLRKQSNDICPAFRASYHVPHMLAKEANLFPMENS
jgi:nitrate/TMAO reductase-like tetraheme cytochrome c subunit